MTGTLRKKSPRAPSISLEEALERAIKVYDRERLHPASTDIIAQHLGYKSANNGRALSTLASLRYFGLLERLKDGMLAVTKEVESYKFAPDEKLKRSLLLGFLGRPGLYSDLLEQYEAGLPSDANLKYELIQRGFTSQSAESALAIFKDSVSFASYYNEVGNEEDVEDDVRDQVQALTDVQAIVEKGNLSTSSSIVTPEIAQDDGELDRIPVRLPGGRRAWLFIPTPFFDADKVRLKAQIDLLLTIEDEDN